MTKVLKKREGIPAGQQAVMLATLRNGESTLRWTRAQFFVVIQTPIAGAVAAILGVGITLWRQVFITIPIEVLGFAISFVWLAAANRAERWTNFWNQKIAELERLKGATAPIEIFSAAEFHQLDREGWSFHWLAGFLPRLTMALWFVAFSGTVSLVKWPI